MNKRIPYLDFLRCLAIVFVVLLHVMVPFLSNPALFGIPSWRFCIFQNEFNRTGVPLFFMLSGYLLLRSSSTSNISWFYQKRTGRILPPLLIWNLIYYVLRAYHAGDPIRVRGFLSSLINQGSSYHMWFVYTLLGIYLLTPFLKRMTDACTPGQELLLIGLVLFPCTIRPLLNTALPCYIHLFDPLMEGYLGYFLLGHWLGSHRLPLLGRLLVYLLGVAGFLLGAGGNMTAAPGSLPFNGGYSLNHYLCAAAIFVFFRAALEDHLHRGSAIPRILAKLADLVFGVYWVHPLVLGLVTLWLGNHLTVMQAVIFRSALTLGISFLFSAIVSHIPLVRRVLL